MPIVVLHQDFSGPVTKFLHLSTEFLALHPPKSVWTSLIGLLWPSLAQTKKHWRDSRRDTQAGAMRRSILALAASSCLASATWNNGRDLGIGIPSPVRETGALNAQVDATGWTPRPTEPPGQEAVMELLRRRRGLGRRQETNTWVNDRTCGWFSGYSCKLMVVILQVRTQSKLVYYSFGLYMRRHRLQLRNEPEKRGGLCLWNLVGILHCLSRLSGIQTKRM